MKILFLFLSSIFSFTVTKAQLKTTPVCREINVDVIEGTVNKVLLPGSTVGQIKLALPCFTSFEEEGTTATCGAGVSYKDKDIYFYTTRNYIEIGPNFKGQLSVPLMGSARNSLFKSLGNAQIKDVNWDAFKTAYGILILYYNSGGKVNKVQFSSKPANAIELCQ